MQAQGEDDEAIAEQPLQVTCGHQVSTGYSTVQYSTVQGQEVTAVVLTRFLQLNIQIMWKTLRQFDQKLPQQNCF